MSEVNQSVRSLWRLIHLLEAEEKVWNRQTMTIEGTQVNDNQTSFDVTNSFHDNRRHHHNSIYKKKTTDSMEDAADDIADNNNVFHCHDYQGSPKDTARSRNSKKRVHSLKRYPAPTPPSSREAEYPISRMLSPKDILPTDQQGWLIDQLRGRRVWCAITKNLFCVFENEKSQISKQVILLTGCQVRYLEFKSADQDGKVLNGLARHFLSKSVSALDKYQFIVENLTTRQKYMFGATSRNEMENWLTALQHTCVLVANSYTHDNDPFITPRSRQFEQRGEIRRSSSERIVRQYPHHNTSSDGHNSSQRKDLLAANNRLLMLQGETLGEAKDTRIDGRRWPKTGKNDALARPAPLKGKHVKELPETTSPSTSRENSGRKSRALSKMKSSLDVLFRRKERSTSADDLQGRRNFNAALDAGTISRPSFTPTLPNNHSPLQISPDFNQSSLSTHPDFNQSLPSQEATSSKLVSTEVDILDGTSKHLMSSVDNQKGSRDRRLSLNLKKAASNLKSILIRHGSTSNVNDFKPSGISLKDLKDVSLSGFLRYRREHESLTTMHCFLSRGCFYAFRSDHEEEVTDLTLALNQCLVTYIAQVEERTKSLFAFKVTQPNGRSLYLYADDQQELMRWMMAMQLEAAKLAAEDNQADQMLGTNLSLIHQLARDKAASTTDLSQTNRKLDQTKRLSCQNISGNDITFPEISKNSSSQTASGKCGGFCELNNNSLDDTTRFLQSDISVDIPYSSLLSGNSTSVLEETQATSETNPCHLTHSSSKHYQVEGNRDLFPTVVPPSNEAPLRPREPCPGNAHPLHRLAQTTQLLPTTIPGVETTTNDRLNEIPELDTPKNILTESVPASDVHSSQVGVSLSTPDIPFDRMLSFSTNQKLDLNKPISTDLSIDSNQSEVGCSKNQYRFDSSIHDDALTEAWSTKEDFLLELVKQKLRARQKKEAASVVMRRGNGEVCIVNDQWNLADTEEMDLSVYLKHNMNGEMSPNGISFGTDIADYLQVTKLGQSDQGHGQVKHREGLLERLGSDEQWHRSWCVLCKDCLCCYLAREDKMPAEVINLAGYDVIIMAHQINGRQHVLHLIHPIKSRVLLSCGCEEEARQWYLDIKSVLTNIRQTAPEVVMQVHRSQVKEDKTQGSPSAETVKQKLLAEVLRQKLELERIQAARAGSKRHPHVVDTGRSVSPTLRTAAVTDEDKTCLLTRLTQRRMSTQIKLNAVQKQMDSTTFTSKDKKNMFQIGKKKPDLVQGHPDSGGQRPELVEQAKLLASKLQELDSCLLSHGAGSPKIQYRTRSRDLRHSYDQALLKQLQLAAEGRKDVADDVDGDLQQKARDKEKLRDVNRSVSLKTTVQKFAHKTLAKANFYLTKKSSSQGDEKGSPKSLPVCANTLSDMTPDVIDVANSSQTSLTFYAHDGPESSDNFQSERALGTVANCEKVSKPGVPTIVSQILTPAPATNLDRLGCMKVSASSPSLSKLAIKHEKPTCQLLTKTDAMSRLTEEDFKENTSLATQFGSNSYRSSGSLIQRRQVSASTLAEIEAFEELSMRFLAPDSK